MSRPFLAAVPSGLSMAVPLGLSLGLTLLGGGAAFADGPRTQRVKTELVFIWSKLPVWRVEIDATLTEAGVKRGSAGSYRVTTRSRAVGVVRIATRAKSISTVTGRVVKGRLLPERYVSDGKFRDNRRHIVLTYDKGRTTLTLNPPDANKDWTTVPAALRQGAPDPMTVVAETLRAGTEKPCSGSRDIYDGRRRYRVTMTYEGEDVLKRNLWNRYEGKAIRCRLTTTTIAGKLKKYANEARKPQPPGTIWFAHMSRAGLWLPVKFRATSRWGEIRGELFKYEVTAR